MPEWAGPNAPRRSRKPNTRRVPPPKRYAPHRAGSTGSRDAVPGERATAPSGGGEWNAALGSSVAHAAGDLLTALCAVTARGPSPVPWAVSDGYDRAARAPYVGLPRRWPPVAAALRHAAWRLIALRTVSGRRPEEQDGVAELVIAVAALLAEIAALHEQRRCLAQAAAARRTSHILHQHPTPHRQQAAPVAPRPPTADGPGPTPRPPTPRPPTAQPPVHTAAAKATAVFNAPHGSAAQPQPSGRRNRATLQAGPAARPAPGETPQPAATGEEPMNRAGQGRGQPGTARRGQKTGLPTCTGHRAVDDHG